MPGPSRTTVPDKRGLIQTTAMSEIACGDSAALLSRRPVNATNAPPANAELFAYWPATSRIGHATLDESNGAALGRFAVGHRSRFFAIHNTKYAYPLIVEMELIIGDKTGATASQRPSIAP